MDIAALSIMLNQNKVQEQVGMSILKIAMDVAKNEGESLTSLADETTKAMELSVQPFIGANLDIPA